MQLSIKLKTVFEFFIAFLKFTSNFEYFEKEKASELKNLQNY